MILGITQMIFGVCLKGINALYFRSYLDFFCEFLPMIIFAVGFFGYMVILIFVKVKHRYSDIFVIFHHFSSFFSAIHFYYFFLLFEISTSYPALSPPLLILTPVVH